MVAEELLFVYGAWKNPSVQRKVLGRRAHGSRDILDGYAVSETRVGRRACPALSMRQCSEVKGLAVEVSPRELERADRYETKAFLRIRATLRSGRRAWVYVRNEKDSSPLHFKGFTMFSQQNLM
jgi:gamma-glutamylcyclotransferase (GGCT)/AIG2-like uncharacterized protein YtfP